MRINDLFENDESTRQYFGELIYDDHPSTWEHLSPQDRAARNSQFIRVLEQTGFNIVDGSVSDDILTEGCRAETPRRRRMSIPVKQLITAYDQLLETVGVYVVVSLYKIENGRTIALIRGTSGDDYEVEQMRNFLANNGSIEDDLV